MRASSQYIERRKAKLIKDRKGVTGRIEWEELRLGRREKVEEGQCSDPRGIREKVRS
jgi:hypothetical protein